MGGLFEGVELINGGVDLFKRVVRGARGLNKACMLVLHGCMRTGCTQSFLPAYLACGPAYKYPGLGVMCRLLDVPPASNIVDYLSRFFKE